MLLWTALRLCSARALCQAGSPSTVKAASARFEDTIIVAAIKIAATIFIRSFVVFLEQFSEAKMEPAFVSLCVVKAQIPDRSVQTDTNSGRRTPIVVAIYYLASVP